MRYTSVIALSVASAVGAVLLGCAIGPNYHRPVTATPQHFKNEVPIPPGAQSPPDEWWTLFHDATLNELISQVEVSNQNLAQAAAAYAAAVAVVRQARATFLPTIGASASATRTSNPGASAGLQAAGGSATTTLYELDGTASWELDIWGKLRRSLENARESARAELADLAYARLSAQNQLATAYLQLRGADAERRLLSATVVAYQRTLEITQNRYRVGTAPKTDVLQAQTQLYTAQQQEAALRLTRMQLENAIASLVGKPASDFHLAEREEWNIPVPDIPPGVPSSLLERRADVRAAEHTLAAANANIGVQEAAYFPNLTLSGTYGFVSNNIDKLFEPANLTRQAAATAAGTVFNFGGTQAQVAQARAQYQQSLASYRQTVLSAFQAVENDLAATDWYKKEYALLKQASDAADETERLTLNEYKAGTVDYTTVVVAQTAALSARVSLAQMAVLSQTAAVSLVTDLGGGWQPAPAPKSP